MYHTPRVDALKGNYRLSFLNRYAITTWYFDKREREQALNKFHGSRSTRQSHSTKISVGPTELCSQGKNLRKLDHEGTSPKSFTISLEEKTTPCSIAASQHEEEIINVVDLDLDCPVLVGCETNNSLSGVTYNENAAPKVDLGNVASCSYRNVITS